jgi:hypothetical protein
MITVATLDPDENNNYSIDIDSWLEAAYEDRFMADDEYFDEWSD